MDVLLELDLHQLDVLRRAFLQNEGLSKDEFTSTMLELLPKSYSEEDNRLRSIRMLQEAFAQVDVNGDGTMEWDEMMAALIDAGSQGHMSGKSFKQSYRFLEFDGFSKTDTKYNLKCKKLRPIPQLHIMAALAEGMTTVTLYSTKHSDNHLEGLSILCTFDTNIIEGETGGHEVLDIVYAEEHNVLLIACSNFSIQMYDCRLLTGFSQGSESTDQKSKKIELGDKKSKANLGHFGKSKSKNSSNINGNGEDSDESVLDEFAFDDQPDEVVHKATSNSGVGARPLFITSIHCPSPQRLLCWVGPVGKLITAGFGSEIYVWAFHVRKVGLGEFIVRARPEGVLDAGLRPLNEIKLLSDIGIVVTAGMDGILNLWSIRGMPDGSGGRRGFLDSRHPSAVKEKRGNSHSRSALGGGVLPQIVSSTISTPSTGLSIAGVTLLYQNKDAHRRGIKHIAYLSSSRLLVTAGYDTHLQVWDLLTDRPEPLYTLTGHRSAVCGLTSLEPPNLPFEPRLFRSLQDVSAGTTEGASGLSPLESEAAAALNALKKRVVHLAQVLSVDELGEVRWWDLGRELTSSGEGRCVQTIPAPRSPAGSLTSGTGGVADANGMLTNPHVSQGLFCVRFAYDPYVNKSSTGNWWSKARDAGGHPQRDPSDLLQELRQRRRDSLSALDPTVAALNAKHAQEMNSNPNPLAIKRKGSKQKLSNKLSSGKSKRRKSFFADEVDLEQHDEEEALRLSKLLGGIEGDDGTSSNKGKRSPLESIVAVVISLGPRWKCFHSVRLSTDKAVALAALYHDVTSSLVAVTPADIRCFGIEHGNLLKTAAHVPFGPLPGTISSTSMAISNAALMPIVSGAVFDGRRRKLLVAFQGGRTAVLNMFNLRPMKELPPHSTDITSLLYCPRSFLAITAAADGAVHVVDETRPEYALNDASDGILRRLHAAHGPGAAVTSMAYDYSLSLLATAGSNLIVNVYDFADLGLLGCLGGFDAEVCAMAFAGPFPVLVTADLGGTINVWLVERGRPFSCLASMGHDPTGLQPLPASLRPDLRTYGGRVSLWNTSENTQNGANASSTDSAATTGNSTGRTVAAPPSSNPPALKLNLPDSQSTNQNSNNSLITIAEDALTPQGGIPRAVQAQYASFLSCSTVPSAKTLLSPAELYAGGVRPPEDPSLLSSFPVAIDDDWERGLRRDFVSWRDLQKTEEEEREERERERREIEKRSSLAGALDAFGRRQRNNSVLLEQDIALSQNAAALAARDFASKKGSGSSNTDDSSNLADETNNMRENPRRRRNSAFKLPPENDAEGAASTFERDYNDRDETSSARSDSRGLDASTTERYPGESDEDFALRKQGIDLRILESDVMDEEFGKNSGKSTFKARVNASSKISNAQLNSNRGRRNSVSMNPGQAGPASAHAGGPKVVPSSGGVVGTKNIITEHLPLPLERRLARQKVAAAFADLAPRLVSHRESRLLLNRVTVGDIPQPPYFPIVSLCVIPTASFLTETCVFPLGMASEVDLNQDGKENPIDGVPRSELFMDSDRLKPEESNRSTGYSKPLEKYPILVVGDDAGRLSYYDMRHVLAPLVMDIEVPTTSMRQTGWGAAGVSSASSTITGSAVPATCIPSATVNAQTYSFPVGSNQSLSLGSPAAPHVSTQYPGSVVGSLMHQSVLQDAVVLGNNTNNSNRNVITADGPIVLPYEPFLTAPAPDQSPFSPSSSTVPDPVNHSARSALSPPFLQSPTSSMGARPPTAHPYLGPLQLQTEPQLPVVHLRVLEDLNFVPTGCRILPLTYTTPQAVQALANGKSVPSGPQTGELTDRDGSASSRVDLDPALLILDYRDCSAHNLSASPALLSGASSPGGFRNNLLKPLGGSSQSLDTETTDVRSLSASVAHRGVASVQQPVATIRHVLRRGVLPIPAGRRPSDQASFNAHRLAERRGPSTAVVHRLLAPFVERASVPVFLTEATVSPFGAILGAYGSVFASGAPQGSLLDNDGLNLSTLEEETIPLNHSRGLGTSRSFRGVPFSPLTTSGIPSSSSSSVPVTASNSTSNPIINLVSSGGNSNGGNVPFPPPFVLDSTPLPSNVLNPVKEPLQGSPSSAVLDWNNVPLPNGEAIPLVARALGGLWKPFSVLHVHGSWSSGLLAESPEALLRTDVRNAKRQLDTEISLKSRSSEEILNSVLEGSEGTLTAILGRGAPLTRKPSAPFAPSPLGTRSTPQDVIRRKKDALALSVAVPSVVPTNALSSKSERHSVPSIPWSEAIEAAAKRLGAWTGSPIRSIQLANTVELQALITSSEDGCIHLVDLCGRAILGSVPVSVGRAVPLSKWDSDLTTTPSNVPAGAGVGDKALKSSVIGGDGLVTVTSNNDKKKSNFPVVSSQPDYDPSIPSPKDASSSANASLSGITDASINFTTEEAVAFARPYHVHPQLNRRETYLLATARDVAHRLDSQKEADSRLSSKLADGDRADLDPMAVREMEKRRRRSSLVAAEMYVDPALQRRQLVQDAVKSAASSPTAQFHSPSAFGAQLLNNSLPTSPRGLDTAHSSRKGSMDAPSLNKVNDNGDKFVAALVPFSERSAQRISIDPYSSNGTVTLNTTTVSFSAGGVSPPGELGLAAAERRAKLLAQLFGEASYTEYSRLNPLDHIRAAIKSFSETDVEAILAAYQRAGGKAGRATVRANRRVAEKLNSRILPHMAPKDLPISIDLSGTLAGLRAPEAAISETQVHDPDAAPPIVSVLEALVVAETNRFKHAIKDRADSRVNSRSPSRTPSPSHSPRANYHSTLSSQSKSGSSQKDGVLQLLSSAKLALQNNPSSSPLSRKKLSKDEKTDGKVGEKKKKGGRMRLISRTASPSSSVDSSSDEELRPPRQTATHETVEEATERERREEYERHIALSLYLSSADLIGTGLPLPGSVAPEDPSLTTLKELSREQNREEDDSFNIEKKREQQRRPWRTPAKLHAHSFALNTVAKASEATGDLAIAGEEKESVGNMKSIQNSSSSSSNDVINLNLICGSSSVQAAASGSGDLSPSKIADKLTIHSPDQLKSNVVYDQSSSELPTRLQSPLKSPQRVGAKNIDPALKEALFTKVRTVALSAEALAHAEPLRIGGRSVAPAMSKEIAVRQEYERRAYPSLIFEHSQRTASSWSAQKGYQSTAIHSEVLDNRGKSVPDSNMEDSVEIAPVRASKFLKDQWHRVVAASSAPASTMSSPLASGSKLFTKTVKESPRTVTAVNVGHSGLVAVSSDSIVAEGEMEKRGDALEEADAGTFAPIVSSRELIEKKSSNEKTTSKRSGSSSSSSSSNAATSAVSEQLLERRKRREDRDLQREKDPFGLFSQSEIGNQKFDASGAAEQGAKLTRRQREALEREQHTKKLLSLIKSDHLNEEDFAKLLVSHGMPVPQHLQLTLKTPAASSNGPSSPFRKYQPTTMPPVGRGASAALRVNSLSTVDAAVAAAAAISSPTANSGSASLVDAIVHRRNSLVSIGLASISNMTDTTQQRQQSLAVDGQSEPLSVTTDTPDMQISGNPYVSTGNSILSSNSPDSFANRMSRRGSVTNLANSHASSHAISSITAVNQHNYHKFVSPSNPSDNPSGPSDHPSLESVGPSVSHLLESLSASERLDALSKAYAYVAVDAETAKGGESVKEQLRKRNADLIEELEQVRVQQRKGSILASMSRRAVETKAELLLLEEEMRERRVARRRASVSKLEREAVIAAMAEARNNKDKEKEFSASGGLVAGVGRARAPKSSVPALPKVNPQISRDVQAKVQSRAKSRTITKQDILDSLMDPVDDDNREEGENEDEDQSDEQDNGRDQSKSKKAGLSSTEQPSTLSSKHSSFDLLSSKDSHDPRSKSKSPSKSKPVGRVLPVSKAQLAQRRRQAQAAAQIYVTGLTHSEWLALGAKRTIGAYARQEVVAFQELLSVADRDRTGIITYEEFLEGLELPSFSHMKRHMESLFKSADRDGDGLLTVRELAMVMFQKADCLQMQDIISFATFQPPPPTEVKEELVLDEETVLRLRELFDMYDVDGGGTIDKKEFASAIKEVYFAQREGISEATIMAEADKMLSSVDSSGDGEIDFDEFCKLLGPAFASSSEDMEIELL